MDKILLLGLILLLLIAVISVQYEAFQTLPPNEFTTAPNVGIEEKEHHPAKYSSNYINEFDQATVSPEGRIAILRNRSPKPTLASCDDADCPAALKEKGFDCFKCQL